MSIAKLGNVFNTQYFCDGCIFLKKEKELPDRTALICTSGEKAPKAVLLQSKDAFIEKAHAARPKWCSEKRTEGTL